jgi:hypothetical protein
MPCVLEETSKKQSNRFFCFLYIHPDITFHKAKKFFPLHALFDRSGRGSRANNLLDGVLDEVDSCKSVVFEKRHKHAFREEISASTSKARLKAKGKASYRTGV